MPDALQQIDAALQNMQTLADGPSRPTATRTRKKPRWSRRFWLWPLTTVVLAVLPFVALVRGSVVAYLAYGLGPWLAVGAGLGLTVLLLLAYALLLGWMLRGRIGVAGWLAKALVVLVLLYGGYALVYVSAENVKRSEIQDTYMDLHPLLRLATSTLVLADAGLVITDGARTPADYARMGLPVNERSLHFEQAATGYVHALDLRTSGRPAWQNRLMQGYFAAMGFHTLRHTGTADHLHVSLPVR